MNKSRIMLSGALGGALIGLIASMLITRRAEKNRRETAITAGEGLKLGILVFGLLRAIASLNDD
jgi:gas vesicle protein